MTDPRSAAQQGIRPPDTNPTWRAHPRQGSRIQGRGALWGLVALAGLGVGAWAATVFFVPPGPPSQGRPAPALEHAGPASSKGTAHAAAGPSEDGSAGVATSTTATPTSPPPEQDQGAAQASAAQSPPVAAGAAPNRSVAFENAPGVLSISLYTRRQETLQAYPTEALGAIALGLEDLRLSPSNKDGRLEVSLAEQLRYEQTDHEVPTRSRRLLDGIARLLAENPDTRVQVLSHTDDEGDGGFNLRLSQRRADALKEYLMSRGVDPERITAVGRGEEAPLVGSSKHRQSRAERAKNRRTELVVESVEPAEEGIAQDVAPEGDGATAANDTDGDAPGLGTGDEPRQDSTRGTAGDRARGR